jgi:hypothetical protein
MRGWYRQGWRHALAARGVKTNYRFSFARKPLITNEEIAAIETSTKRNIGDMSDDEISGYVQELRSDKSRSGFNPQPRPVFQNTPVPAKKVDYLEPFRSPEEKSDIGKQMVEQEIASKVAWADEYMTRQQVTFDDKKRIMDHYVNPLAEKFRKGNMSKRDFDIEVEAKVKHNGDMNSKDGLGAFSWAKEQPKKLPDGKYGAFNFIDKAKEACDDKQSI